ncbi:MAG: type II toxin-antitoxin system HicA family toxin [Bacteroidales bacterium]|nr:type II toxin-antitoxin system HicA family toxin [Bacteroidales bacterium]
MKYSEIHRKLRDAGCYVTRNGSRHPIWVSPITGKTFSTSYHEAEEAKSGTIRCIRKLSGVNL